MDDNHLLPQEYINDLKKLPKVTLKKIFPILNPAQYIYKFSVLHNRFSYHFKVYFQVKVPYTNIILQRYKRYNITLKKYISKN